MKTNNALIMTLQEQRKIISERLNDAITADNLVLVSQNTVSRNDLDVLITKLGLQVQDVVDFRPYPKPLASYVIGNDGAIVIFEVTYDDGMEGVYHVGTLSGDKLLGRISKCKQKWNDRTGDAYFMYGGSRLYAKDFMRLDV